MSVQKILRPSEFLVPDAMLVAYAVVVCLSVHHKSVFCQNS